MLFNSCLLDRKVTITLLYTHAGFKLLFPRVQQRGESVFIPQLDMLTQYCKVVYYDRMSKIDHNPFIVSGTDRAV